MPADLAFRIEDFADPARRAPWLGLLRDIFEIDLAAFSALDIWHPGYRAFCYWDGKVLAAHIAIRPLSLMVDGVVVPAAQLHGVATRPDYRNRGLFSDLMARVLDHASGRFQRLLLFTPSPELYQSFGFRLLPQHCFIGTLDGVPTSEAEPVRRLLLGDPDDRALIRALHATRQPVSKTFALADNAEIFFANALYRPEWQLLYLSRRHALLVVEGNRLIDVVAAAMPPAAAIRPHLDPMNGEVEICFPPDRLAGDFRAEPFQPPEDDHLMFRGPLAMEDRPILLPPTAIA